MPFASIDELESALAGASYLPDRGLATALYLSLKLEKPLLLEGEAGVGKTEAAKAIAQALGARVIRLQCYEGLDVAHAVYEWNYARQLLHIRAAQEGTVDEAELFGPEFLIRRPLLEALEADEPVVLLIDEVDRADEALEAVLLETLAEFQVSVPEVGTFTTEMSWRSSAARTRGWPTRWPSSWSTSSAGCVSWSSASRPRSPRPSTGHARWRCSASRS